MLRRNSNSQHSMESVLDKEQWEGCVKQEGFKLGVKEHINDIHPVKT